MVGRAIQKIHLFLCRGLTHASWTINFCKNQQHRKAFPPKKNLRLWNFQTSFVNCTILILLLPLIFLRRAEEELDTCETLLFHYECCHFYAGAWKHIMDHYFCKNQQDRKNSPEKKKTTLIPDTAESRSSESYHFLTFSWEEKSRRHTGCLRKCCFSNAGAIQGKNTLIRTH